MPKRINVGPGKFGKKNKQNMQTYVKKNQNICRPWKKFQNLLNVGSFNKAIGPAKNSKLINVGLRLFRSIEYMGHLSFDDVFKPSRPYESTFM